MADWLVVCLARLDDERSRDVAVMPRHLESLGCRGGIFLLEQHRVFEFGDLVAPPDHLLQVEPVSRLIFALLVLQIEAGRNGPAVFLLPEPRDEYGFVVTYPLLCLLPSF